MLRKSLIFSLLVFSIIFIFQDSSEQKIQSIIQKSMHLSGIEYAREHGLDGQGIKIGIIDTGIDYNHPDLLGYGPLGKTAGGYDYVNANEKPLDTNGHGTEVAGIVSGDGNFTGMAPKSKLFSYKVSSSGESVSSDYIVKAIHQAIEDKVDVINISLGINKTNDEIDDAIDEAGKNGIVVVVAAGNNGPKMNTIGSPGRDINTITVGASYNNITSSLVSTFEVGNKQYQALPMLGTKPLTKPVEGKIINGSYGRLKDLENSNVKDSILLEERGSDTKGEKVYFAEKEKNASEKGAKALIVFNNQSGIFFGELVEPNTTSKYVPKIPVISMSKDDGLALRKLLTSNTTGVLDVFNHPDFVAPFSSRGPVSPFYIKPDLVAPGVFVNSTTLYGKYNLTSGTSVAAPHVSGAVALLLQKYSWLTPSSAASLIATTTDPVTDAYGNPLPIDATGSGRLNITRASNANLIISPHSLVFNLSYDVPTQTKSLHLQPVMGLIPTKLKANFLSNETNMIFDYYIINDTINIKMSDDSKKPGDYEGFIILDDSKTIYRIPVIIHLTKGTIISDVKDGELSFSINYPDQWSYAKISLMKAYSSDIKTTSIIPQKVSSLATYDKGEYWITAQIKTSNGTDYSYQTIIVSDIAKKSSLEFLDSFVPLKQVAIISSILIIIIVIGLTLRKR